MEATDLNEVILVSFENSSKEQISRIYSLDPSGRLKPLIQANKKKHPLLREKGNIYVTYISEWLKKAL